MLAPPTSLLKDRSVVIADDDDITRQLLRETLRSAGFNVIAEASDGARALDLVQRLKPEIVCLDIDMPELSGLEVLAKIREHKSNIVVLMITSATTGDNVRGAISTGADGIVAKPFNTAKIVAAIERALSRPAQDAVTPKSNA